jgi:hypothetical protein
MKNRLKFIWILLVFIAFGTGGYAQITASAYAEATIVSPLTITKNVDMNFGNVAVINSAGTVILSTASARTSTGGATPVANPTGTVTAAQFTITGAAGFQVFVTLPASDVVTHLTLPVNTMTVNTFVCSPVTGFIIPVGGSQVLNVGATLITGANQVPGIYRTASNFNVTVNYQ